MPHTTECMSAKIHNGYRLADHTDVWALQDRFRELLNPIRRRREAEHVVAAAVRQADIADLAGENRPDNPLFGTLTEWMDRQGKLGSRDYDFDPFNTTASFGRDTETGHIWALLHSHDADTIAAFESLDSVEPWPYWNNTERPDDVTEDEWEQRRLFWNRALPGAGVPARHCLTFAHTETIHISTMMELCSQWADGADERNQLLVSCVPSMRQRVRDRVVVALADALAAQEPRPDDIFRTLNRIHFDVTDQLRGDGDNPVLQEVIDAVEKALDPDIGEWLISGRVDVFAPEPDLTRVQSAVTAWVQTQGSQDGQ